MGWLGSPSYFSRAHRRQPQPCRRRPSATCPHQPLPPAQGGRGEPSPGMEPEGAVQPSTFKGEVEGESVASSKVGESREGRFLLYWITTTSISTSTSFTTTFSVSSALCTPAGAGICG